MQTQSFQIIPVVDLMHGEVVHAKHGQRAHYKAIRSRLCTSSDPLDVVAGLLKLYPFETLYIADIDAILGTGNHDFVVEKLKQSFPDLTLWLDSGMHQPACKAISVLGSESLLDIKTYLSFSKPHVLSLDFNANGALGSEDLHNSAQYWPPEVICMSLSAVGSNAGVDSARLQHIIKISRGNKIYAAGGVRNIQELHSLTSMGVSGALVASALHNGEISDTDLSTFFGQ